MIVVSRARVNAARNAAFTLVLFIVFTSSVFAQGRGRFPGRGGGDSTAGSIAVTAASGPSSLQFGSWLDDASLLAPGEAWTAVSMGYFRTAGTHQTGFPILDASLGLTPRVQVGLTVPYYRLHVPDGTGTGGLGDVYVSAKISLIDAAASPRGFGVAVTPILEALGEPQPSGNKYSWAAPVSFELRGDEYRVFGSTGFFSRGVFFTSAALEIVLSDHLTATGAVTTSRSLKRSSPEEEVLALSRNRTDVTGIAAYFLTPSIAAFGGVGRTLGSDPLATSFLLVSGVSVSFSAVGIP